MRVKVYLDFNNLSVYPNNCAGFYYRKHSFLCLSSPTRLPLCIVRFFSFGIRAHIHSLYERRTGSANCFQKAGVEPLWGIAFQQPRLVGMFFFQGFLIPLAAFRQISKLIVI